MFNFMFNYLQIYYKLFVLLLKMVIRSRSIPLNPILELNLDVSSHIVYILPYYSVIDLSILHIQCLKNKLPDPLEPLIINNIKLPRCIFIYKKKRNLTSFIMNKGLIKLIYKYFDLYIDNNIDLKIIPVYIMIGRCPNIKKNKINILIYFFKKLKKILNLLWLGRDIFINFYPFVSLKLIVNKYGSNKDIVQKLIRVARIYFIRWHFSSIGPYTQSKKNLFSKILSSPSIIRVIEDKVRIEKISYQKAKKHIVKLVEEIAANFSYEMVRLTDRILSFTWNRLYQGIDVFNINRVRQLTYNGYEIVYLPCHRSHIDYLLLSYVLYHHGLMIPYIVAGINLNFWPIGLIFRRLGAFFIRRNFNGNKIYSTVFREYLSELFNLGCSIEYFIEGSRSRTGYLMNPKTGILSMTIQAMLRGKTRPIALVPIYIGYEHIIEINSYAKELYGSIKEKENLFKVLCSLNKLSNLGQGYVNFGEPLLLNSYLNQHIPDWYKFINKIEYVRPFWLMRIVNDISTILMVRINNSGVANAINLCCTALLASSKRSLTREQLTEQLNCYLDLICNVPYSADSAVSSNNANILIDHALKTNKFKIIKNNIEEIITLSTNQIVLMTYYRNNIIHMLILPSLIAAIFIHYNHISYHRLTYYINIFYPMIKAELFLRWNYEELNIELNKLISELFRQKLIKKNKNKWKINPLRFHILKLLAASSDNILQRYTIIFWLLSTNSSINRNLLKEKSQILTQRLSLSYDDSILGFFEKKKFNKLILTLRDEGYINDLGNIKLKETIKIYKILSTLIKSDIRSVIENI